MWLRPVFIIRGRRGRPSRPGACSSGIHCPFQVFYQPPPEPGLQALELGNLGDALPVSSMEPIRGGSAFGAQAFQVLHGHFEDVRLFQLGVASRLWKREGVTC